MNPEEIFFELGIEFNWGCYCCGRYKNMHVRYLEREGVFQVGEPDSTFDRWSNSVDFEFAIWQPKGMRQFIRWALTDNSFGGQEFYNKTLQIIATYSCQRQTNQPP